MFRPLSALAVICILACGPGLAGAADLTIACGRSGAETARCREAAQTWAAENGHRVQVVTTPADDAVRLARYLDLLAVGTPELDVLEIDALWSGRLAGHLTDLRPFIGTDASAFLAPLIRNATLDERLVALPWYLELGLLYYRSDLLARYHLPVPRTWDELAAAAGRLQEAQRLFGNTGFWGLVWADTADEGLTAAALEWIAGAGGGTLVAPDGQIAANEPPARSALQRAAAWVGDIVPPAILPTTGPDSLALFRSGQAAFMRHWSSAWGTLQDAQTPPVTQQIGVAPLPAAAGADAGAACLGGGQLAVSRYSRYPTAAAELVRYLTGAAVQRQRADAAGFNPTRPDLYTETGLLAARPLLTEVARALPGLIARPSTPTRGQYPEVSAAFAAAVRAVLGAGQAPDAALAALQVRLAAMSQNGTAW